MGAQVKQLGSNEQAAAFLNGLIRTDPRPYAERARLAQRAVAALLARVGNPHHALKAIHIAGSKGKGSTALMLEAILRSAGYRVGTFTSPHLQRWTERFRINGREIDDKTFTALLETLRPHVGALRAEYPEHAASFFDVATAAALLLFRRQDVDYAIVEAGLGGRFDATNIVQSLVACITTIELEHTDKLGATLADIAWQKAGITKPGVPLIAGCLPATAAVVVGEQADALNAPLLRLNREIQLAIDSGYDGGVQFAYSCEDLVLNARLALPGRHQADNAALAIACAQRLPGLRAGELRMAVTNALARLSLPGRTEILSRRPWIVIDAAHTRQSMRALTAMLATLPVRRVHMVLSVSSDRNLQTICAELPEKTASITLTRAEPTRSLAPEVAAAAIAVAKCCVSIIEEPRRAIDQALQRLADDDLLCITGSVYMAGVGRCTLLGKAPAKDAQTRATRYSNPASRFD